MKPSRRQPARPAAPDRFRFERECWNRGVRLLAGVDEAGRGPLAGPVIAAAVVLPTEWGRSGLPPELEGLNDSKQLSEERREEFYVALTTSPEVRCGIGEQSAEEIDRLNILAATHRAMSEALAALHPAPEHVLVDGTQVPGLAFPQTALVKGDSLSYSIAAASVLAKVTRDRRMLKYDRRWPHYGFAIHKGYPTPEHLAALREYGPSPIHRWTFAPLKSGQRELFGPT